MLIARQSSGHASLMADALASWFESMRLQMVMERPTIEGAPIAWGYTEYVAMFSLHGVCPEVTGIFQQKEL